MQNREVANTKYYWGKKLFAMQGIPKRLEAIEFCIKALSALRSIDRAEVVEQDDKSFQEVLDTLLRGFNTLLSSSSDWSQIVGELEKILIFYVESVNILNESQRRLPNLNALEVEMGGPFTVLTTKAPSESQLERYKNYLAVITLFHDEMVAEEAHKLSSNDPIVTKSFALYQRALNLTKVTRKVERPVEVALPPPAVVPKPAVVSQPSAIKKPVQAVRASPPAAEKKSSHNPRKTYFRIFDNVADDGPKRVAIREMMERKQFVEALAGHRSIVNCVADDYRRACECQLIIGKSHAKYSRFSEAITCFIEALRCCKHIQKDDVLELDNVNIANVFNAFIKIINIISNNWMINFEVSSKCMVEFLNFYVDHFDELNSWGRRLPGLDRLSLGCLMKFIVESPDQTWGEKTRIYLTIIRMFRKDTIPELGDLMSMIDETEIKKDMWVDESMSDTFDLFDRAFALASRIKGHAVLNPELNVAFESKKKRLKGEISSYSSSSLDHNGL